MTKEQFNEIDMGARVSTQTLTGKVFKCEASTGKVHITVETPLRRKGERAKVRYQDVKIADKVPAVGRRVELEQIIEAAQARLRDSQDETDKVEMATCGSCGLSWNDAAVSSWTPTPSGRCPFESIHGEVEELQRLLPMSEKRYDEIFTEGAEMETPEFVEYLNRLADDNGVEPLPKNETDELVILDFARSNFDCEAEWHSVGAFWTLEGDNPKEPKLFEVAGDERMNPELKAEVQGLRTGMAAVAEQREVLPERFTVEQDANSPRMVFTDTETGRQTSIGLYAYGDVRRALRELFGE